MERGSATTLVNRVTPKTDQKQTKKSFTVAPATTISARQNLTNRIAISYHAEGEKNAHVKRGLNKAKAMLGLDYEGVELNLGGLSQSSPKQVFAQSIEVNSGSQSLGLHQQEMTRLSVAPGKGASKYKPLHQVPSGGILARQISMEDIDGTVRDGEKSALSLYRTKEGNVIAQQQLASQTQQPSKAILKVNSVRSLAAEADEPWAEIARFNNLLDMKIKLDEASEVKRKHSIQKAYLDQQVQLKAHKEMEKQHEKSLQRQKMENLVEQIARDKTDLRNKEYLRRMQEKAARINAVHHEKNQRD